MEKKHKINKNRDYNRVYSKGRSKACFELVTYVLKNRMKVTRMGITTSKKIGNAVNRNRARRIIREAYRQVKDNVKIGYDIIFVARKKTCEIKMNVVKEKMKYHLEKLGIIE